MKKIRKAVIPAAGYGTRFLPETKAMPKEMLPIVDKPVIQYVVEDLVEAGIEQIVIITGWHKRAIEDHFDRHLELENKLKTAGKLEQLDQIRKISDMAEFVYVRQKEMRGNGDAILTAKNVIGDEPFVVCWGDEIMLGNPNKTSQLIDAYNKFGGVIMGSVRTDKPEDKKKYGFAKGPEIEPGVVRIDDLVEKPGESATDMNLATLGGFLFPPEIFAALESCTPAEGEELVYIDGINVLRQQGIPAHAVEITDGKYYDCGNVAQYMKTNIEMALKRPGIGEDMMAYLKELTK